MYNSYDRIVQKRAKSLISKTQQQLDEASLLAYGMKDGSNWKTAEGFDYDQANLEDKLQHGISTLCRGPGVKVARLQSELQTVCLRKHAASLTVLPSLLFVARQKRSSSRFWSSLSGQSILSFLLAFLNGSKNVGRRRRPTVSWGT